MFERRSSVLVLCAFLSAALAAEEAPPVLTLDEARARALARNWDLLAARADLDSAEAQRLVARALPNPGLSASVAKLNATDLPEGATPTGSARDTIVALTQLIEVGGKRGSRIRSAEAAREAALARFEFARIRLDGAVVKAYVAALAAQEAVRVDRLSAASLSRSAEIATLRFRAGEVAEVEREQVAIAAGRFDADTRTAEASAVQAGIALQVLLGATQPDGRVTLADDLARLGSLGAGLASRAEVGGAAEIRPDVRAAAATVDQARADWKLQRALRIPDPTLLVQYENDRTLPDPHSIGVGVSLPLPVFSRNPGGIRAAEVARDSASRSLEQARARARAEAASARAAYDAARQRRALVQDDLLPRAVRVQQTVAFSYEKGGASLLELLEAERNLNDVRLAALSTQAEALSAAADLAVALGERLE